MIKKLLRYALHRLSVITLPVGELATLPVVETNKTLVNKGILSFLVFPYIQDERYAKIIAELQSKSILASGKRNG
jgi:hypothetical protein